MLAPLGTAARPDDPSSNIDVDLNRRVAAAVKDLPALHGNDTAHHGWVPIVQE